MHYCVYGSCIAYSVCVCIVLILDSISDGECVCNHYSWMPSLISPIAPSRLTTHQLPPPSNTHAGGWSRSMKISFSFVMWYLIIVLYIDLPQDTWSICTVSPNIKHSMFHTYYDHHLLRTYRLKILYDFFEHRCGLNFIFSHIIIVKLVVFP